MPPRQLFVCAKSIAFAPPIVMVLNVNGEIPTLANVTVCRAEVVPTTWLPNSKDVVLRLPALTCWVTADEVEA